MNQKQDYIIILEFGKDITSQGMKWKGNPELTTFFKQLYSKENFEKAINIIKKDDVTSRNIIAAIQKIEGLIFSGKYIHIIKFLIDQLNNKKLRNTDVINALENRLKREFPNENNSGKNFKFKGGKSKKHKKRGSKKTRKDIKRGGLLSFLSSLNPFNILRSRTAVVPTNTDENYSELEEYLDDDENENIPFADQVEPVQTQILREYNLPGELSNYNGAIQFNPETGNYIFTEHGHQLINRGIGNSSSYDQYNYTHPYIRVLLDLNEKKLKCESNFKTGFKITRYTLILIGIILGMICASVMPAGVFGFFSVGILFAMLFGIPVSGAIISGAILSVENYIIKKYCISSAKKRNTEREARLGIRWGHFENLQEVEEVDEADAFHNIPVDVLEPPILEEEEEKEDNPGPYNRFKQLPSAKPQHPPITILNPKTGEPVVLSHEQIEKLIKSKKNRKTREITPK